MKKTISLLLSIILVVALIIPTMAADVTSFSDVPTDHWGYQDIMTMVQQGLFNGTSDPDENGVATFSPEQTMTRAQFIAVLVRYLFPDEQGTASTSDWWSAEMNLAEAKGLVSSSDFGGAYDNPCSRQEMAYILVNAAKVKGESFDTMDSSGIPDYASINSKYQDSVLQAVRAGLITGMDDAHTFSPNGTMIRAQGATVLNRLIDASRRADTSWITNPTPSTGAQQWVEGQSHNMPHKGDIVTKADGTQVVLDYGYGGVLGAGQGVDIYTGWNNPGGSPLDAVNASGQHDMTTVLKDSITGETHTVNEWVAIQRETNPKEPGSYVGEVRNTWYTWDGAFWINSIPR